MKHWMLVLILAAGCGSSKSADSPQPAAPEKPTPSAPGSYTDGDANSDEAKQQAAKAVELLQAAKSDPSIKLTAVRSFSQQVVAGMNYKLGLDVSTAAGPREVDVVLFVGVDHHAELTQVTGM